MQAIFSPYEGSMNSLHPGNVRVADMDMAGHEFRSLLRLSQKCCRDVRWMIMLTVHSAAQIYLPRNKVNIFVCCNCQGVSLYWHLIM